MAGSLAERIAAAEQRLGFTFPDDWKAFLQEAEAGDVYTGEDLMPPEALQTLAHEDFEFLLVDEILPEDRPRIVPFYGDGAGNFGAFDFRGARLQIIDLDHEAGIGPESWDSFSRWRAVFLDEEDA